MAYDDVTYGAKGSGGSGHRSGMQGIHRTLLLMSRSLLPDRQTLFGTCEYYADVRLSRPLLPYTQISLHSRLPQVRAAGLV